MRYFLWFLWTSFVWFRNIIWDVMVARSNNTFLLFTFVLQCGIFTLETSSTRTEIWIWVISTIYWVISLKGSWVWHLLLAVFSSLLISPLSHLAYVPNIFKTSQATDESDPTLPFQPLTLTSDIWDISDCSLFFLHWTKLGCRQVNCKEQRLWTQKDLGLNSGSARCYLCDLGQVT